MGLKSAENGKKGERIVSSLFKDLGYWVHIIQRNNSGQQPFDIVAAKSSSLFGPESGAANQRDFVWLVDAKYVDKGERFDFSDIQPDQLESMNYAKNYANLSNIGFAIIFKEFSESIVFFLPFDVVKSLKGCGKKSVHLSDIGTIKEWEHCVICAS